MVFVDYPTGGPFMILSFLLRSDLTAMLAVKLTLLALLAKAGSKTSALVGLSDSESEEVAPVTPQASFPLPNNADYHTKFPKHLQQTFTVVVRFEGSPDGECAANRGGSHHCPRWAFERSLQVNYAAPKYEDIGFLSFEHSGFHMRQWQRVRATLIQARWSLSPQ